MVDRWALVETPIGPVTVGADRYAVRGLRLQPRETRLDAAPAGSLLAEAVAQLAAYFAGERTGFDLPLSIPEDRGSEFERAVWQELARIPFGQMCTYGEVARAVGDAGAARAVGTACNRNPVPLIVPCHRVVGAGGKLVGFGGGLHRKRWLLEHEAKVSLARDWS
ncbi:MAG: methylated-DNA--[protein]-cysteine S-methyltransferase [Micromonosporaceae bacterium]|nr:methylated-DNA--[protein]-cysteine S-methyltransferase [Micromonosporaceae bacterium]